MKKKNQPHDRFFKAAFSERNLVKDFLIEFLPAAIVEKLHFESLQLSTQSFITKELQVFYSDLIYTCDFGEDQEVSISLLFEHKSNIPALPHLQLLRYMVEMWENQLKAKEKPKVVIPIVLYQGRKHWGYRNFWDYFEHQNQALLPYFPEFKYCLVDLSSFTDGELLAIQAKHLSFALYLMKQISSKVKPEQFLQIAVHQVYGNELDEENDNLLFSGIVYILQTKEFTEEELNILLNPLPKKVKKMGMTGYDRLIKKGVDLSQKRTIEVGYRKGLSVELMAELTGLSQEEVQKMIKEISENEN